MKLIEFKKRNDFGVELITRILSFGDYTVLQVSVSYSDYTSWPYLQVGIGMGKLFGMFFYVWKVGFDCDILGGDWRC